MAESYIVRKGGGGGAQIEESVKQFIVEQGKTVTAGRFVKSKYKIATKQTITTTAVNAFVIAELSSTSSVVFYNTSANQGAAVVVNIDANNQITFGTPVVFQNTSLNATSFGAQRIAGTNRVLFIYGDQTSGYLERVRMATISGTSITFSSPTTYQSYQNSWTQLVVVSESLAFIVYRDGNDGFGKYARLNLTTSSVSVAATVTFNSNSTDWISVTEITTDTILVSYRNSSANHFFRVFSSSSMGTAVQYFSGGTFAVFLTKLTSTTALAIIGTVSQAIPATTRIITVSGTSLTLGTENSIQQNNPGIGANSAATLISLDANRVIYFSTTSCGLIGQGTSSGFGVIGTISGGIVTWGNPWLYNDFGTGGSFSFTRKHMIAKLPDSSRPRVLVIYTNNLNSNFLTISSLDEWSSSANIYNVENTDQTSVIGLAKTSGTGGQTVDVYIYD
jgi:hypothetical protein